MLVLEQMLKRYGLHTTKDYRDALREIIQEIALLGLWRAKFFEHAAFYGGTALRILYGLNRYSEDLDFSLLHPDAHFSLKKYDQAIACELNSYGFHATVTAKQELSKIQSAFIKVGTKQHLLEIKMPEELGHHIHADQILKIKIEVDVDPPLGFKTEAKTLLYPFPFSVLTYAPEDLFAGKMHAILCRTWSHRVKGRDWYDLIWFVAQRIPLHLAHLESRLKQSEHLHESDFLTQENFLTILNEKIEQVNFDQAKKDITPFIQDTASLDLWSADFFHELTRKIKFV